MSRIVVVIDGEHYPPVVRETIVALARSHDVAAAVFAGGTEKVGIDEADITYGVPVVRGTTPAAALVAALKQYAPDMVVDLSDEPVISSADRFRLASIALGEGVSYVGADFQFDPPEPEVWTGTPTLAVVGTGKRVGKTAVSAHVARLLHGMGTEPVVLAMGRGGPEEPELLRGDLIQLTTEDLLGFARQGRHASSDNYEDAVMSRVMTVGCRRCGGGLAGTVFASNVPEGARLADTLGAGIMVLEGSGSSVPPVGADATMLVIGASQGPGYVTDYFGPLRLAAADAVIVAGAEPSLVPAERTQAVIDAVKAARPDVPVCVITFRPRPITPIAGRRVFFATTAPAAVLPLLSAHLEKEYGCTVVASSSALSDRMRLMADMKAADGTYDTLATELKAAAIDVVAMAGEALGVPTVLTDNVPVAVSGDDLEEVTSRLTRLAMERAAGRNNDAD